MAAPAQNQSPSSQQPSLLRRASGRHQPLEGLTGWRKPLLVVQQHHLSGGNKFARRATTKALPTLFLIIAFALLCGQPQLLPRLPVEQNHQQQDSDPISNENNSDEDRRRRKNATVLTVNKRAPNAWHKASKATTRSRVQRNRVSSLEVSAKIEGLRMRYPDVCAGKERMLGVLVKALGIDNVNNETCVQLPDWSSVSDLYYINDGGDGEGESHGPVVLGLETCGSYREMVHNAARAASEAQPAPPATGVGNRSHLMLSAPIPKSRKTATSAAERMPKIAGLWNTGTTALSRTFLRNFLVGGDDDGVGDFVHLPVGDDVYKATVPWGKHTVLKYRYNNTWPRNNRESKDLVMPVLLVRDPFRWMNSMCNLPYGAQWRRGMNGRCPNLIPTPEERMLLEEIVQKANNLRPPPFSTSTYEVRHTNYQSYFQFATKYQSLADMWSSFNGDYYYNGNGTASLPSFPRLVVRMEDTIFYAEELMEIIANCTGLRLRQPFEYVAGGGKDESTTTLATAMRQYGTDEGRIHPDLTREERLYLRTALNPELMRMLRYRPIRDEEINQQ